MDLSDLLGTVTPICRFASLEAIRLVLSARLFSGSSEESIREQVA